MLNEYFVYRYIRLDSNTPFYVGKGKNNRARRIRIHNKYCRHIAAMAGYEIEYVVCDLSEPQALEKEKEFIALYKNMGYCEANFTIGGERSSGFRHTEETKKRIGAASKGNTYARGKTHKKPTRSAEHIAKIVATKIGKSVNGKPVICLNTGVEYSSCMEVQRQLGIRTLAVARVARGERTHTKELRFKWL